MADFEKALRLIMRNEGGYVNDPTDPGGETKYGISKKQYPGLNIRTLTIEDATMLYHRDYWQKINGYGLGQKKAEIIFDTAVNIGVRRAIVMAQTIAGVRIDGIMGPVSLKAINAIGDDVFLKDYVLERIKYYLKITRKRRSQRKYLYNWFKRTVQFV